MEWYQVKLWVSGASGLDMDALHVHVGVLAQLAVAFVLRKKISSVWPWLVVAAATLANEAYDLYVDVWPTRNDQHLEGLRDIWNTMLLPTVLLLLSRFAPGLFAARLVADSGEAGESGGERGK